MHRSAPAILIVFGLVGCLSSSLGAQSTVDLPVQILSAIDDLPESTRAMLASEGEIVNLYAAPDGPRLVPVLRSIVEDELQDLEPGLGVEVLSVVSTDSAADILRSFRILQSVSTMQGIEYYSASRGYYRTLFHESYAVSDPDSREQREDPFAQELPESERLYVYQRDSSFGKNVYEVTYRTTETAVLLSMTNRTRMMYRGIIPAIGPGKLLIHIAVVPADGYVLLYGSSGVDSVNALGIEERARDSFYNRIIALHSWYLDRLSDSY